MRPQTFAESSPDSAGFRRIPPDSLPPYIFPVPSGEVEIAIRQRQGYAYIKP